MVLWRRAPTDGPLTVTDEAAGNITIEILSAATGLLSERGALLAYDIKLILPNGKSRVLQRGGCTVKGTITRKTT